MSNKKFIIAVIAFFFSSVVIIGIINFVVDPGNVYLKKYFQNNANEYAETLLLSKNGLVADGWNERIVKAALAKYPREFDCIVFGSSHVMQISQIREVGNIQKICSSLLNLGVSGGALEDLTVFTSIILNNQYKPKKVFIGIDPWTFKFNMGERYLINKQYFDQLNSALTSNRKNENEINYEILQIKNLFNLQYFSSSLLEIYKKIKQGSLLTLYQIKKPNGDFNYNDGYKEPVTLPDGSHLYESEWIKKQKNTPIAIGGGDYNIRGEAYESNAIDYFKKIVKLYQHQNIEVSFIITPYHANVFKVQSKVVEHIAAVETLVYELSRELSCRVLGSFYPDKIKCTDHEFYDFMHPTTECLDKIKFEGF